MRLIDRVSYVGRFIFVEHAGLTAVLALALYIRVWLLTWWQAGPFGDVFNYVRIAQLLPHLQYPVSDKRLPFYPFLILIAHTVLPIFSWEAVAIGVAIGMSLVTLALLYAIGRRLGLNKSAILVGLLLMASFPPFLQYSIRGYGDTTFTALLAAAILSVLYLELPWMPVVSAVLMGALCLTRYEGIFATLILLPIIAWKLRSRLRQLALIILVLALMASPYVLICLHVGRSLLPTAYLSQGAAEDQGYGAKSFGEWEENYRHIWGRLGLNAIIDQPKVLWGELRDDTLGFHQQVVDHFADARLVVGAIGTVGIVFLFWRRRLVDVLTVGLPYLVAGIPIAWWAPLIRYDAFLWPMMVIASMAGFHLLEQAIRRVVVPERRRLVMGIVSVFLVGIAATVWLWSFTHETHDEMRKSQYRQLAWFQAEAAARPLPGVIAFDSEVGATIADFSGRVVYGDELFSKTDTPADKLAKLHAAHVTYIVMSPQPKLPFGFLLSSPAASQVQEVKRCSVEEGNGQTDTAVIYRLL